MAGKPIAVIDIGSNSMHLIVARICQNGTFEQLDSHKVTTRLAAHLDAVGNLSEQGLLILLAALKEMKGIASGYSPDFRVIATHATRTAKNRRTVISRAYSEVGLSIEVIDGLEEARLSSLGMSAALSLKNCSFLGLDIGGGSTEIIFRSAQGLLERSASLQLGTVALQRMFMTNEGPTDIELKRLKEILHYKITPLASEVAELIKEKDRIAIACSGTAKAVGNLICQMKSNKSLEDANAYVFTDQELKKLIDELEKLRSPKAIRSRFQVDKDRSEVVLVGAEILGAITSHLNISKWSVSTYGLREGIVLDSANMNELDTALNHPRMAAVKNFAKRYRVDEAQAHRVEKFASTLYDQIGSVLPGSGALKKDESLFIKASSWLHEIGKFVGYSKYHKHSHYLIANGTLQGFTEKEKFAIALICRYHRKKNPVVTKDDFEAFTEAEAIRLASLAGILRLSASLARGRRNAIQDIQCTLRGQSIHLEILASKELDPDVELARIEEELAALDAVFNKTILVSKRAVS